MKNILNYTCGFISEAMSIKKLIFLLIFLPSIILSQDINDLKQDVNVKALREMSDKEINAYWIQAQERGYTLDQIKILARAQGASESDLMEFEKRIKDIGETDLEDQDDDLSLIHI